MGTILNKQGYDCIGTDINEVINVVKKKSEY